MLHPSATIWACHGPLESAALVFMQMSALAVYPVNSVHANG